METNTDAPTPSQTPDQTMLTNSQPSYQAISTDCQSDNSVANGEEGGTKGDTGQSTPGKWPEIFTLCAICFANICSATFYSLLAPFFTTEAKTKGASSTAAGIILSIFKGVVFVSSPIFGSYLTTFGARFMFITGTFATSTCAIFFGMLQWCPPGTIFVVMCLCVRSVEALSTASTITSSQAIAAHTFSTRLSSVMGIIQACECIGLMLGPPIGGSLYALDGFYLPFVVSGGLFMIGGTVNLVLLPQQKVKPTVQRGSKLALLKIPAIPVVGCLVAVGQMAIGFIDVALAIHLQKFDLHPAVVGLVFLIPAVVVVVMAPIVGWVTDKNKNLVWPVLIVGTGFSTSAFLLMGPSPLLPFLPSNALWLVITGLVISGVGWSSTCVCLPLFMKSAHDNGFPDGMGTHGLVSGVFNAFDSLGGFIGPILGGFLLEKYKFPWSSTLVAAATASVGVLLLSYCVLEVLCSKRERPKDDQIELLDNKVLN